MAVSDHYLTDVIERLSEVAPISYRRIFAGVGVYHRGVPFAMVANDRLYFRVDDSSRQPYLDCHMPAFEPEAAVSPTNAYYQVPASVIGRPHELFGWMRAAVEAAQKPEQPLTLLETATRSAPSATAGHSLAP